MSKLCSALGAKEERTLFKRHTLRIVLMGRTGKQGGARDTPVLRIKKKWSYILSLWGSESDWQQVVCARASSSGFWRPAHLVFFRWIHTQEEASKKVGGPPTGLRDHEKKRIERWKGDGEEEGEGETKDGNYGRDSSVRPGQFFFLFFFYFLFSFFSLSQLKAIWKDLIDCDGFNKKKKEGDTRGSAR